MFSMEYRKEINADFDRQMALLDRRAGEAALPLSRQFLAEKKEEISGTLALCTEEEAEALTFLYSAMPLSDLIDYPASLFLAYAKHGVFLWNQGPFAGRVPERLFANYVLHHRVNNEDIADTRGFFYDRLKDVVRAGKMYDTAIEANYWCAKEATYRSTDNRTQNPRTMYYTATGRCGEESTFAGTVLRSIGIPARQIYAPLWTHCDDNHAWVELWCDGEWHFLGACEPEEALDRGWFTGPASRAVMLRSKWFGKDEPGDPQVGVSGMAKILNHLDRYARTLELTVKAVDEAGCPVPQAKVTFQVLNHGYFGKVAELDTGSGENDCGTVKIMTGFGDLYISITLDREGKTLCGEQLISLGGVEGEKAECRIVLKEKPECGGEWEDFEFHAPALGHSRDGVLTEEQCAVGEQRLTQAAEYRQRKLEHFYEEREAERVLSRFSGEDRERLEGILRKAHGNINEIIRFMEWDADGCKPLNWQKGRGDHWKLEALETLREKDYWDIRAEVLIDCCASALPYATDEMPEEIFYRFLLCPRVSNEMLRPCRAALGKWFGGKNPRDIPKLVDQWVVSIPEQEYENLITSSLGCLKSSVGSRHSKEVLCVNLCRALGIPARLNFLDGGIEYYDGEKFVAMEGKEVAESCTLTLCEDGSLSLSDWAHYSVARLEGGGFQRLWLWGKLVQHEGSELKVQVNPGIYRAITTNRKKNGDQLARIVTFELREGECRNVSISMREISLEDSLVDIPVPDIALRTLEGDSRQLYSLAGDGKALFLWLGVTREPTEHILNELYDKREEYAALETPVYAVLRTPEDLENETLRRTLEALPGIRTLLGDFGEPYRSLAETVGEEPGKLPLALILNGQRCIYSDAGYNVGLADMLYKIIRG